uniref:BAR domain-containing protein n=1 Tax=Plectus sambesii TaxID=2011161 RepID=A0A914WM73_9BILA
MECPTTLDFTEALKDSPRFRKQLHDHEQYFSKLETKLNEVLRLVTAMVEYGQNYVATFYNVTSAMSELSKESFSYDPLTVGAFASIADAYTEVVNFHKILIEQAHWSIHKNINAFLNEIGKVHETRQHFEQLSASLDEALGRKAAIPRHKTAEVAESKNALTAVGTCFAHTALDYVAQVNVTHARKNHEILDAFSSFLRACRTFFDQGQTFFTGWSTIENGVIGDSID